MIPSVVFIMRDPEPLQQAMTAKFEKWVQVFTATTGIDGLLIAQTVNPFLVVIDNDLPDFSGSSLASIIKDFSNNGDNIVYLINASHIIQNTKADCFLSTDFVFEDLCEDIIEKLEFKLLLHIREMDFRAAINLQNGMLPKPIKSQHYSVNYIFSPYNQLSGDGLYFWESEDNQVLGFMFDCVGHELSSYAQVSAMFNYLRKAMISYKKGTFTTLSEVMTEINTDILAVSFDNFNCNLCRMTPAIVFFIDFKKGMMKYCPAGFPAMLIKARDNNKFQKVSLRSYPLGYKLSANFEEYTVSVKNMSQIVFTTDGYLELLQSFGKKKELKKAKHDDVSAIYVNIK